MNGSARRIAVLLAALAAVLSWTARAFAQVPPPNDNVANALMIPAIPFMHGENTEDATNEGIDPSCAGSQTVWFTFMPTTDETILIDTSGSDYPTSVGVFVGPPANQDQITCLSSAPTVAVSAGTTYFIVVGSQSGSGGNLALSITTPFHVTIGPKGTFDPKTGSPTVQVAFTCDIPVSIGDIEVFLNQRAGRLLVQGFEDFFFPSGVTCDPTHPFSSALTVSQNLSGLFRSGNTDTQVVFTFIGPGGNFDDVTGEATVKILGGK